MIGNVVEYRSTSDWNDIRTGIIVDKYTGTYFSYVTSYYAIREMVESDDGGYNLHHVKCDNVLKIISEGDD